jgi:hypothetical protein
LNRDFVAYPLVDALSLLDKDQLKAVITYTHPTNQKNELQEDCLYVVRQVVDNEGIYQLAVAAKMRKEVY